MKEKIMTVNYSLYTYRIFVLLAIVLIIPATVFTQNMVTDTLCTGEWSGTDGSGKEASIVFDKDGFAMLKIDGQILGSRDTSINKKGVVRYVLDYTKDPVWLDFNIYNLNGKQVGAMKTLVKIYGCQELDITIGFALNERPKKIDVMDNKNTMVLHRVQ